MTFEDLVEDTFNREGRRYAEPPEIDQPTAPGGITLETLSEYLGRPATLEALRALTVDGARPILRWKLEQLAIRHGFMGVGFGPLRVFLIDFAYNSGPGIAVRWLQRVLRVQPDGVFGPATNLALEAADGWLVLHAMIAARLEMIDAWTDAEAKRKAWEEGLENRVLSFSLLRVK